MSAPHLHPIWTPADAAALAALAAEYPQEIGASPVLAEIMDREALQ